MTTTFTPRPIPPNIADPAPLLLGEAFSHLRQGPLLSAALTQPVPLIVLGLAAAAGLWLYTPVVIRWAAGAALALLALVLCYLCWHGRFVRLNKEYGTLCPRCTSRLWQLCCGRCREPVPPLALMWRGALLPACPHCGLRLSSRAETLLAWCSTCVHTEPRPDLLYRKPMYVIVWVVDRLPELNKVRDGWQMAAQPTPAQAILYHRGDPHSACLLLIANYRQEAALRFEPHIIARNHMLLAAETIPQANVDRFRATLSKKHVVRT